MFKQLSRRFTWLSTQHPITDREARRMERELPKPLRKLVDPWTMLGYAAIIHGLFFAISLIGFNRFFYALPTLLLPFLTPFGTPIAAAMLHSIVYWIMLIGLSNYTVKLVGRDFETGTWDLLRLTPMSSDTILNAKLASTLVVWGRVMRSVFLTRLVAVVLLPIAVLIQRNVGDAAVPMSFNLLGGLVFLAQPFVDSFLIVSISALAAVSIRNVTWAKIGAYGVGVSVYGALSSVGALWLMLKSPMGMFAAILVPLSQWSPLVASVVPAKSSSEFALRIFVIVLVYFVLPLIAAATALWMAKRQVRAT